MIRQVLRATAIAAVVLASTAAMSAESDSSATFRKLLDDHWAWALSESPVMATRFGVRSYDTSLGDLSVAGMDRRKAALEGFVKRLEAIPDSGLSEADRINKAILLRDMRDEIEAQGFGHRTMLFTTFYSWHTSFAGLGDEQPLFTKADFESYVARLNDYPRYNAQGIATSRQAVKQGYVQACDAMVGFEKTIEAHVTDDLSKSVFMKPFERKPASVSDTDWASLKSRAEAAVRGKVVPAYKELLTFYTKEYAPKCRKTASIAATPNGAGYYKNRVRVMTTTDLTPEQIHKIGLDEVARIRSEMEAVAKRAGFQGDRKAFIEMLRTEPRFYAKTPEEMVLQTSALAKRIDGELPKYFYRMPRLPYTVKPIPADQAEGTTTAYYEPGLMQAGRAGTYRINTSKLDQRPLFELPALTLHEAVPGHHFQIALQQETETPNFRRYLVGFTAFTEGWALYTERLGYDMGLYEDPYAEFGRLSYEMWRACRLVVDTGIHSKGWTKQQAIDFMLENTALSRHNIEAEVNRYISWPGQALGYKIGEIKIRELRAKAEKALGEKFDIRAFHDAVLENGSVPLDVLEAHIDQWIAGQQKKAA